jgi:hypothetical protein
VTFVVTSSKASRFLFVPVGSLEAGSWDVVFAFEASVARVTPTLAPVATTVDFARDVTREDARVAAVAFSLSLVVLVTRVVLLTFRVHDKITP